MISCPHRLLTPITDLGDTLDHHFRRGKYYQSCIEKNVLEHTFLLVTGDSVKLDSVQTKFTTWSLLRAAAAFREVDVRSRTELSPATIMFFESSCHPDTL